MAAAFSIAGAAHADEIYRWVDDNGVVNYTQQKPRGVEVQQITTRSGGPSTASTVASASPTTVSSSTVGKTSASSSDVDPANLSDAQKSMLEDLQAAETARNDEIAKIRVENCERSRAVLSRLTAKERIRVRNPQGAQRIMPEDERASRIQDAQMGIATNCNSA